jgi:hypothetical protein
MSERVCGSVINVHALGATVRLEDGRLAAAPLEDVNKHRPAYARALAQRTPLLFERTGRAVTLATPDAGEAPILPTASPPALNDPSFEAHIIAYLKQTEEWAPADRPQPFERHLFRKRARAKQFRGEAAP